MPDDVKPPEVVAPPPAGGTPAPPAADPLKAAEAQLAAMQEQNKQLAMYAALMEQQAQRAGTPAAPAPEPEPDDTDPEVKQLKGTVTSLSEQIDQMQFANVASGSGYDQTIVKEVEDQLRIWRNAGMTITDNSGAKKPPNRADALRMVLGQRAIAEAQKGAPTRAQEQLRQMMQVDRGGGAGGAGGTGSTRPADEALAAMKPKDRAKVLAAELDKTGF